MWNKIKKWNWTIFWVIIIISILGSLTNKSVNSLLDVTILVVMIGLPMGLLWAWISKE